MKKLETYVHTTNKRESASYCYVTSGIFYCRLTGHGTHVLRLILLRVRLPATKLIEPLMALRALQHPQGSCV